MPALCLRPSASCDGFATGRVWIRATRRRDAPRMPTLRPRQTALYVLAAVAILVVGWRYQAGGGGSGVSYTSAAATTVPAAPSAAAVSPVLVVDVAGAV